MHLRVSPSLFGPQICHGYTFILLVFEAHSDYAVRIINHYCTHFVLFDLFLRSAKLCLTRVSLTCGIQFRYICDQNAFYTYV
jgi:hypothetical protein